jgi:hypothetical protein
MMLESFAPGAELRHSLRAGCAVIVGIGVVVALSLILLFGAIQSRLIRPPLGELPLGPLVLVGARRVTACTSPAIDTCRDDFFVLKVIVRRNNAITESYQLMRISLK